MPLPASWVDHLFAKLSVRWGAAFMRQWPDTDPALVKADWADVLDRTSGDSISYALRYLPVAPCTAMAFRDLCRRAPAQVLPALTDDGVRADTERVRALVAGIDRGSSVQTPAQRCADAILASARGRGRMSPAQRAQIEAMRQRLTPLQRTQAAAFVPSLADMEAL